MGHSDINLKLAELRKRRAVLKKNDEIIGRNYEKLAEESQRVGDLAATAKITLNNLDDEFEKQTGLDRTDWSFLLCATALQISRWILIGKLSEYMDSVTHTDRLEHDDKSIKDMERGLRDDYKSTHDIDANGTWEHNKSEKYPTWLEIAYDGVPYDVTRGSSEKDVNMDGRYHRFHTLGHDPLLGWIFGVNDIIASTITLNTWDVYVVNRKPKPKHFGDQINLFSSFARSFESINEDWHRLPAAVFAQGLHLESDLHTKLGLPIPILEVFDPKLAGRLYKEGYDSLRLMKDKKEVSIVGLQAVVSILINLIIGLIHGLYYDPSKYTSREIYEVKTRKILLYSNMIASASNVIWVGSNAMGGNEGVVKDLDLGGLMVTAYRLFNDAEFIKNVKEEFVFGKFRNMIQGEKLNLEEVYYEF